MESVCRALWRCAGLSALLVAMCCSGCGEQGPPEYPASQVFWFPDSGLFMPKALAFSPDGRFLAIGLAGNGPCTGQVKRAVLLEDEPTKIYHMEEILGRGEKGVVYVVDLASEDKAAAGMQLPEWVNSLAFTPDGKTMVAGTGSLEDVRVGEMRYRTVPSAGAIVFWDTKSWKKTDEWKVPGAVVTVVVSPNGRYLATMSSKPSSETDREVRIWDVASREEKAQWALNGRFPHGPVRLLAFSPDSTRLAAMDARWDRYAQRDDPARVMVWNVQTGEEVRSLVGGWSHGSSVAFSQDGRRLIAGVDEDEGFSVWNTETWQLERFDRPRWVAQIPLDDTRRVYLASGDFRSPRRCGIVGCDDNEEQGERVTWLVSPNKRATPFGERSQVTTIAVSSDGKLIAVAGRGDEVCVWNMPDLSEAK